MFATSEPDKVATHQSRLGIEEKNAVLNKRNFSPSGWREAIGEQIANGKSGEKEITFP
ncbi:MAG: hypothetical protein P8P30_10775 [Rickettsiales bacterium]|nr:hypothetical protein [Rickettsiales bacterium]